jgi:hypothetical protein
MNNIKAKGESSLHACASFQVLMGMWKGGGATVAHPPPPLIKGCSRVRIQFSSATQLYIYHSLAHAAVAAAAIIASRSLIIIIQLFFIGE